LEEHEVSSYLFDFDLEFLHELFVCLTFLVDFYHLLDLEFLAELFLLPLEVLHHLIGDDTFASDLDQFLLKDFGVLGDLPEGCDITLC